LCGGLDQPASQRQGIQGDAHSFTDQFIRLSARTRPLPADLAAVQARFASCFAVDGTTLEALLRKLQMQQDQPTTRCASGSTAS
jgi:hypothetical protein